MYIAIDCTTSTILVTDVEPFPSPSFMYLKYTIKWQFFSTIYEAEQSEITYLEHQFI